VGPAGVRPAGIGPAGSAAGQVASLLSATDSPSVRPLDVLQVLSDRRGEALVQRDASALGAVHVDGSPSAHADQLLVASLRASGTRWVGLRAEVSEARFVSGDRGTVVIRARVDWTAYAVVDVHGVRGARAAERGALLDFHLEWAPAGWRIASISAAPAT
jgi:serine/threonine-protein kinase